MAGGDDDVGTDALFARVVSAASGALFPFVEPCECFALRATCGVLADAVAAELDPVKRTKLLHESFAYIRDNVVKVGLHQQVVLWAAKDSVQLTQLADNIFPLRMVKVK